MRTPLDNDDKDDRAASQGRARIGITAKTAWEDVREEADIRGSMVPTTSSSLPDSKPVEQYSSLE